MNGGILYRDGADFAEFDSDGFFRDLRLDTIIAEIAGNDGETNAHYRRKPKKPGDILFRLAVMKDLERPAIREIIESFLNRYGTYRNCLEYSRDLPQRQTKQKWLLDAACVYCGCLADLYDNLQKTAPDSEGLRRFAQCLGEYMGTEVFKALRNDAERCAARMDAVRYTLEVWLYQNRIAVRAGDDSADDYCERFAGVFQRYGIAAGPKMVPFPGVNMESLELAVLERLCEFFPDEFKLLEGFCGKHSSIGAEFVDTFAAELRFYLSYIVYMDRMREKGYAFSHPVFHERNTVKISGGYDLSLAQAGDAPVTTNDFVMESHENFIVTGPNQGGKTAYARMVGQVAYFASLGLPSPCAAVEMYFIEGIYTHFAREEDLSNNYGRLKEELQRAKRIIDIMPGDSLLLFNDLFSSTTTFDALEIGGRLLESLKRRGCLCLFVTNIHELAAASGGLVCLNAAPDHGTKAYRVTREPAGRPHTDRRVSEYHLCYEDIRSRVK